MSVQYTQLMGSEMYLHGILCSVKQSLIKIDFEDTINPLLSPPGHIFFKHF